MKKSDYIIPFVVRSSWERIERRIKSYEEIIFLF